LRDYLSLSAYILNYNFKIDIYTNNWGKVIKNVEIIAKEGKVFLNSLHNAAQSIH